MNYYIIAGEASGDLHASNLIKELRLLDNDAHFRCWGGDLVKSQNAELVKHYKDTAYMGFLEVILHLPAIIKNINYCKKDILQYKPDALILVDYPGFNLRIAEFSKSKLLRTQNPELRTYYYISPQVWAWKSSRIKKIKKFVDKMFVILPFEKNFYKKYDYDVDFVGHPLLDAIESYNQQPSNEHMSTLAHEHIIALLPGSRKQEISKILSVMLKVIPSFPDYQFVIAAAPSIPKEFYDKYILKLKTQNSKLKIIYNDTYNLLANSVAAIVTSGTATLETALFEVPEVVCYKGSGFSYMLAKHLVKVKYISLVNLIMDKQVVTELIQDDLTADNIKKELTRLLHDNDKKAQISSDYKQLKTILGGPGASRKTAQAIFNHIKQQ
jgi:lipid-A-disaccharide synthase